jgi:SMI1 / KNR4 family (SUKH-1)
VSPIIERVRTVWERQGIQNRNVATDNEIGTFENKYAVALPPIVREYFCELNGTKIGKLGMEDGHFVGFWHLDQVRPIEEECPEYATGGEPNLFIFADYSIWALGYAVRLSMAAATAVFLVGGSAGELIRLAPDFEEFLRKYAAGDETVLFP